MLEFTAIPFRRSLRLLILLIILSYLVTLTCLVSRVSTPPTASLFRTLVFPLSTLELRSFSIFTIQPTTSPSAVHLSKAYCSFPVGSQQTCFRSTKMEINETSTITVLSPLKALFRNYSNSCSWSHYMPIVSKIPAMTNTDLCLIASILLCL